MHAQSYKSIKLGYSYDFLLVLQRIEKRKHFICVGKVFLLYFPRCENNYKYFTYSLCWFKNCQKYKSFSWIQIIDLHVASANFSLFCKESWRFIFLFSKYDLLMNNEIENISHNIKAIDTKQPAKNFHVKICLSTGNSSRFWYFLWV
jgi:hypothetical protein